MNRSRFRLLAAFLIGAVATYIGAEVSRAFWAWNDSYYSVTSYVASTLVSWLIIGLGGTAAALLARRLRPVSPDAAPDSPPSSRRRAALDLCRSMASLIVVSAWVATGVFGVPASVSAATARSIATYKWIAEDQHLHLSAPFPRINTSVAAPVLPGLVLIFHGAQLAGQAGGGGWELYLWYGTSPRLLHRWTRWYS